MTKNKFIKVIQVKGGCIKIDLSKAHIQFPELKKTIDEARELMVGNKDLEKNEPTDTTEGCRLIGKQIDKIFGEKACMKIFGTQIPSLAQIENFIDKVSKLIYQWFDEMEQ